MSEKPLVTLGTVLPQGKVVSIRRDCVTMVTASGLVNFSFNEVERMVFNG